MPPYPQAVYVLQQAIITPIQTARGLVALGSYDNTQNYAGVGTQGPTQIYDFSVQGAANKIEFVQSVFFDNTLNPNSMLVFIPSTGQRLVVQAGTLVTLPIFAMQFPKIQVACIVDAVVNSGYSQFLFSNFDLGFNISTTSAANPGANYGITQAVVDMNLYTLLNGSMAANGALVTPGNGKADIVTQSAYSSVASHSTIALPATTQTLLTGNMVSGRRNWMVQNLDATALVYVALAPVSAAVQTAGIRLAPGEKLFSQQVDGLKVYTNAISAYASAACSVNLMTA